MRKSPTRSVILKGKSCGERLDKRCGYSALIRDICVRIIQGTSYFNMGLTGRMLQSSLHNVFQTGKLPRICHYAPYVEEVWGRPKLELNLNVSSLRDWLINFCFVGSWDQIHRFWSFSCIKDLSLFLILSSSLNIRNIYYTSVVQFWFVVVVV